MNEMECDHKNFTTFVKNGHTKKGKQRYICKICRGKTFSEDPPEDELVRNNKIDKQILQLYLEGIAPYRIAKLSKFQITDKIVSNRIAKVKNYIHPYRNFKDDLRNANDFEEILKIIKSYKYKFNNGIVVIGLDINNPFSLHIEVENSK